MKIRRILYATLSFLTLNIGICPNVGAVSTLQLTETSQEINGIDSEFRRGISLLPAAGRPRDR